MSLSDLLEMDDEEVFELINEEYELSKKQTALYNIINDMMDKLVRIKKHEEEIRSELEWLQKENTALRNLIANVSK